MGLFEAFEEISAKQWKQKIQFDLQGADYNQTLRYKTLEGITIKPFYHKEDLKKISLLRIKKTTAWNALSKIHVTDTQKANKEALLAIKEGADGLYFEIESAEHLTINDVLIGIPTNTLLFINVTGASGTLAKQFDQAIESTGHHVFWLNDPLGAVCQTGDWLRNKKEDFTQLRTLLEKNNCLKSCFSIKVGIYQNNGAHSVQQLAYALAHAVEYLTNFENNGALPHCQQPMVFEIAIGSNFFFEIAKIQALRILWQTLAKEYHCNATCYIIATPSLRNKSILGSNNNLIRSTMECLAGVFGGADAILNTPYDVVHKKPNTYSRRLALNQLHILREECQLKLKTEVTKQTYYIESVTAEMTTKALVLFKSIEQSGGLITQLKEGTLQRKIKETAVREQTLFDTKELPLIGVNNYLDNSEIASIVLEKDAFPKKKAKKTQFTPLQPKRLAYRIEKALFNTNRRQE